MDGEDGGGGGGRQATLGNQMKEEASEELFGDREEARRDEGRGRAMFGKGRGTSPFVGIASPPPLTF